MATSKLLNNKRRKLSSSKPVAAATTATPPTASKINVSLTCVSCHRRLLNASTRVFCARCASPTCTICSRTCSTRLSPRPPETPHSPRRSALSFNSVNTNGTSTGQVVGSSRKRRKSEEVLEKEECDGSILTVEMRDPSSEEPGCGRVVCKKCCFESNQSNATTCYDCYGSEC